MIKINFAWIKTKSLSADSTHTPNNFSLEVFRYDGLYTKPYDQEAWLKDIYKVSKVYKESVPYQAGIAKQTFVQSWMLILLLFGFGSLAFVRAVYRKRFSMLFQAFVNWKISKQIIRYEKVYTHPVNLLLMLNFVISIPLFLSVYYVKSNQPEQETLQLFVLFLIPLLAYLLIKLMAYQFTAWLLEEKEAMEEYVFQTNLFNKYLGVVYLFLASLLIYSPIRVEYLYYSALIILLFFLVFQLIRGALIGVQQKKNLFLIIVYLCTLEILPWLVFGKWVNNLH